LKSICVIPARGGSKRIPKKNILKLNGIPLISYTIRAAIKSNQFDAIFVSTENEEIKSISLSEGVKVDDRPLHMAGDRVTKIEVIKEFLERHHNLNENDIITALLPTCPFRTQNHINEAFKLFKENSHTPFLVGVTEYEFPIQLALKKTESETMSMVFKDGYNTTRSQNIEKRYHPNGAMYIARIGAFLKKNTFFNSKILTYEMEAIHSYDIDYPYQFDIAEILAKKIENNEL
jgi:CMP-N-acetylneuraminic acid synthetase